MTTFYIVRHGQSEANTQNIVQGADYDTPLTHKGRNQAHEIAEIFTDIDIDMVYSSDAKRAYETAVIIAEKYAIPHHSSPQIRERTFGKYEGMDVMEFLAKYDKTNFHDLSLDEQLDYQIDENEESNRSGMNRLVSFLEEKAKEHTGKTLVVVTHGGVIRPFLIVHEGGDFESIGGIENCGYVKVTADNADYKIVETKGVKSWVDEKGKFTK